MSCGPGWSRGDHGPGLVRGIPSCPTCILRGVAQPGFQQVPPTALASPPASLFHSSIPRHRAHSHMHVHAKRGPPSVCPTTSQPRQLVMGEASRGTREKESQGLIARPWRMPLTTGHLTCGPPTWTLWGPHVWRGQESGGDALEQKLPKAVGVQGLILLTSRLQPQALQGPAQPLPGEGKALEWRRTVTSRDDSRGLASQSGEHPAQQPPGRTPHPVLKARVAGAASRCNAVVSGCGPPACRA